ncbi:DUF3566 domain-containing protein [Bifidobacterium pullorum subsp. saeculare]|uniref:DUF3566 domain-containing protein n=1 Tax=Bifidobacterium pullorum subsp. saeculare TaxID=78257 RepID=A0A938WXB2_9BIFI|nr:DUF3566 domain-containing protein [Bifidobacterium pullorum]MBM6699551.1 DUF3566 domain-containing protein [Bifidobacterium pullorum subsp. saeculare]
MSDNLEEQAPVVDPLAGRSGANGGQEHGPRVARSVSSAPESQPVRKATKRRGTPRARRMSLSLTHINPWSVAKVSFMLSIALGIIQIVAVALVWLLLDVVGVFNQITSIVASTGLDAGGFNLDNVFSISTVLSAVTIFSIVEVVLFTLIAAIGAALYNAVSALVGGIHVTLGDD